MKIEKVEVGYLRENCYVISKDNHVLIVDPGDEFSKIKKLIGNQIVDGILITHHHFDHIGAIEDIKKEYAVDVYDFSNLKEQEEKVGTFTFQVIYNPGHSKDSISFYFPNEKVIMVGDFIFKESIGRCDLPGGSMKEMYESLEKIKKYPEDVKIYPGHGDSTTLKEEIKNNPYF